MRSDPNENMSNYVILLSIWHELKEIYKKFGPCSWPHLQSVLNEFSTAYFISSHVIASSNRHVSSPTVSEVQESGNSLAGASGLESLLRLLLSEGQTGVGESASRFWLTHMAAGGNLQYPMVWATLQDPSQHGHRVSPQNK